MIASCGNPFVQRRLIALLIVFAIAGCGTIRNMNDPAGDLISPSGEGTCHAFGGVARSGNLACVGPASGTLRVIDGQIDVCGGKFEEGFQKVGEGAKVATLGLMAIVDTALSLAGDLVTLPIVRRRQDEAISERMERKERSHRRHEATSSPNQTLDAPSAPDVEQ